MVCNLSLLITKLQITPRCTCTSGATSSTGSLPSSNTGNMDNPNGKLFYLKCNGCLSHISSPGLNRPSLQDMPDPYGRYANLMARHPHLKSTFVNTPNIRDRNGTIKFPSDHSTKLGDQKPVFIMVKLRL